MIEVSAATLAVHPFLRRMSRDQLGVLAETACDVSFQAGDRLFEEGGNATQFWLIQSGHVGLDLHIPGEGPVIIETIGMGELLGWSWLFPPYRWAFGAAAVRERCTADPGLGYELDQRIARVLAKRLQATRIRLIARLGYSEAMH
jgi:CRP/FNR family transcriptional regulator, cyclic AMP receptor protein